MSNNISPNEMRVVIERLVGELEAVGETYEDQKRHDNIMAFEALCDYVCDVLKVAERQSTEYAYSVLQQGKDVMQAAHNLRNFYYDIMYESIKNEAIEDYKLFGDDDDF